MRQPEKTSCTRDGARWGRRGFLLVLGTSLATSLSGCFTSESDDQTTETIRTVTTPEAIVLGPEDSGRTVSVPKGRNIRIVLPENPSTGYEWHVTRNDEVAVVLENRYISPTVTEVGAPGTREVLLEAIGSGQFAMEYVRPWETTETPERQFVLTITIDEAAPSG